MANHVFFQAMLNDEKGPYYSVPPMYPTPPLLFLFYSLTSFMEKGPILASLSTYSSRT